MKKLLALILTVGIFAAVVFVPPAVGRFVLRILLEKEITIAGDLEAFIGFWLLGALVLVIVAILIAAFLSVYYRVEEYIDFEDIKRDIGYFIAEYKN